MAKIGDIVRFLNSVGGGRITRIDGQIAYVEEDGFETPVMLKECVVVVQGADLPDKMDVAIPKDQPAKAKAETKAAAVVEPPFVETTAGERLNIVLGYEPTDIKHLSQSTIDAYLVNDSNFYLYFSYLTRSDDSELWTNRYAGIVEPATQVLLGEVEREDLNEMDRVAVQFIAFKKDKKFEPKAPAWIETKLDTTKFFKLHCFQRNPYFDSPVIALDLVRNDIPARDINIDPKTLKEALHHKEAPKPHVSKPSQRRQLSKDEPLVIDLHIDQLIDTTAGLSNTDMLNLQLDKFREVMDANAGKIGKKIVFIHGKGDGVLRKALLKELGYRYKKCLSQDASFREYGFGATQITIH